MTLTENEFSNCSRLRPAAANKPGGTCNSFIEGVVTYDLAIVGSKPGPPQNTMFCPPHQFKIQQAKTVFLNYCDIHANDRSGNPVLPH
jgi:hypothetical protein